MCVNDRRKRRRRGRGVEKGLSLVGRCFKFDNYCNNFTGSGYVVPLRGVRFNRLVWFLEEGYGLLKDCGVFYGWLINSVSKVLVLCNLELIFLSDIICWSKWLIIFKYSLDLVRDIYIFVSDVKLKLRWERLERKVYKAKLKLMICFSRLFLLRFCLSLHILNT